MSFRSVVCCCALAAGLGSLAPVAGQGVGAKFATFKRVDANPAVSYQLTEAHGPWLIMATSFAGQGAEQEARQLVLELRKRYKLNAYTHVRQFDYRGNVEGKGFDKYGAPKKMKHMIDRAYDEVAVMVGDFPSIDDPQLQETLKQIKYLRPTSMPLDSKAPTTQRFANLRTLQRIINSKQKQKQMKGPLGSAFVARNPMLPQEYFTPTGFDRFVESMNKDAKYSLLNCKHPYSVRVATFRGSVIIDQNEIAKIEKNGGMRSGLNQAAEKAIRLATALRKKGVEAYEFHDRHESIVTVGSFASVGTPREDGKVEIDPEIYRVIKSYGPVKKELPNGAKTAMVPRSLAGISFDLQPVPVQVPRRSIAADYSSTR